MLEKEPISSQENKLIIPKTEEIFNSLVGEKQKEPERKPIDREDFVLCILADIEAHQGAIITSDLKIGQLQHTLQKMHNCESLGYKLNFYEQDHAYGFNIKKKSKAGFRKE